MITQADIGYHSFSAEIIQQSFTPEFCVQMQSCSVEEKEGGEYTIC